MDFPHLSILDEEFGYCEDFFAKACSLLNEPALGSSVHISQHWQNEVILAESSNRFKDIIKAQEMPTSEIVPSPLFQIVNAAEMVHDSSSHSPSGDNSIGGSSQGYTKMECMTKNFLQTFKAIFLKHLVKCFGPQVVNKYDILKKIKRSGMYKSEVLKLFKEKDFKGAWEKMFAEGTHIELLMQTRIAEEKKIDYLAVVHVLEKAYQSKRFPKINDPIYQVQNN